MTVWWFIRVFPPFFHFTRCDPQPPRQSIKWMKRRKWFQKFYSGLREYTVKWYLEYICINPDCRKSFFFFFFFFQCLPLSLIFNNCNYVTEHSIIWMEDIRFRKMNGLIFLICLIVVQDDRNTTFISYVNQSLHFYW